jgi:hypothetical protein
VSAEAELIFTVIIIAIIPLWNGAIFLTFPRKIKYYEYDKIV